MTFREFFHKLLPLLNDSGQILTYQIFYLKNGSVDRSVENRISDKSLLIDFFDNKIKDKTEYGIYMNQYDGYARFISSSLRKIDLEMDTFNISNERWWEFINDTTRIIERTEKIENFLL